MIDRRALMALTATFPLAGRQFLLNEHLARIDALYTGEIRALDISPDGSVLVGMRGEITVCILDAHTGELLAESEPFHDVRIFTWESIRWSPDWTRIAFSLIPIGATLEPNLFVVDVATAVVINVTPVEPESATKVTTTGTIRRKDMYPAWRSNDSLLFIWEYSGQPPGEMTPPSLVILDLTTGETETWIELEDFAETRSPIWQLSDQRLVISVDISDRIMHLIVVTSDGEIFTIEFDHPQRFGIIDVNDTVCLIKDADSWGWNTWIVPLDAPDSMLPVEEPLGLSDTEERVSRPALGPEPGSVVVVVRTDLSAVVMRLVTAAGERELAEIGERAIGARCHWVDDHVFVRAEDLCWVIPINDQAGIKGKGGLVNTKPPTVLASTSRGNDHAPTG
jgi:hypothetical protein